MTVFSQDHPEPTSTYIPKFRVETNKIGKTNTIDYKIYDHNPNNPWLKKNLILSGCEIIGPVARMTFSDTFPKGKLIWNMNFSKIDIPLEEIFKLYHQYVNLYESQIIDLINKTRLKI